MKNKKRTGYLLLAVILIYGAVIARFFMLSNEGGNIEFIPEEIVAFKPTQYKVKESFTIDNDYRDPFLGTFPKNDQASNQAIKQEKKPIEDTSFPTIKYMGVISDAGSNKRVLSLRINGKEYITKVGSTVDSVGIVAGNIKNITVSYKGKRKVINITE